MPSNLAVADCHRGESNDSSYIVVDGPAQPQLQHSGQDLPDHAGDQSRPLQSSAFNDAPIHANHAVQTGTAEATSPSGHPYSLPVSNHSSDRAQPNEEPRSPGPRHQTGISPQTICASSLQILQRSALSANQETTEWLAACRRDNFAVLLPASFFFDPRLAAQPSVVCPIQLAFAQPTGQEEGDSVTPVGLRGIGAWVWDSSSRY